jgi:hypothetical protein
MDDGPSPLSEALARLSISDLWNRRGWPGLPGKSCRVPYRPEDKREAGSVFVGADGLEKFHDFKSGETMDAPGLLAAVEGIENREACRRFIEAAGTKRDPGAARSQRPRRANLIAPPRPALPAESLRIKPTLPALVAITAEEIAALARQRGLDPGGLTLAALSGLLHRVDWGGKPCWAVADGSGWNAQFRRMDGLPFHRRGREAKTLGVSGGRAAWPLGLPEAAPFERVLLVEGLPDLLAAFDFIFREGAAATAAAVTMAGASLWIPPDALPFFAGKRVRIFPHAGDATGAGMAAGLRWQTQLEGIAARVRCFDFAGLEKAGGEPVGDLNDLALMAPEALIELGTISDF